MPTRLAALALGVLIAATIACEGPTVLFPGGALEGEVTAAPSSWAFMGDIDTIQLETNPSEPYSVNIWVVGLGPYLYVHAGANRATWIEHMEADSRVRLRADGTIYELEAFRVAEQSEFDRFADVYEKKYGNRPRNESVQEAYLFRLAPRG